VTNLKLFVDALQPVDRSIQASDFIGFKLQLLLEILDLALVSLALPGVLSLQLILWGNQRQFAPKPQDRTLRSAMDSTRSTSLVSSS